MSDQGGPNPSNNIQGGYFNSLWAASSGYTKSWYETIAPPIVRNQIEHYSNIVVSSVSHLDAFGGLTLDHSDQSSVSSYTTDDLQSTGSPDGCQQTTSLHTPSSPINFDISLDETPISANLSATFQQPHPTSHFQQQYNPIWPLQSPLPKSWYEQVDTILLSNPVMKQMFPGSMYGQGVRGKASRHSNNATSTSTSQNSSMRSTSSLTSEQSLDEQIDTAFDINNPTHVAIVRDRHRTYSQPTQMFFDTLISVLKGMVSAPGLIPLPCGVVCISRKQFRLKVKEEMAVIWSSQLYAPLDVFLRCAGQYMEQDVLKSKKVSHNGEKNGDLLEWYGNNGDMMMGGDDDTIHSDDEKGNNFMGDSAQNGNNSALNASTWFGFGQQILSMANHYIDNVLDNTLPSTSLSHNSTRTYKSEKSKKSAPQSSTALLSPLPQIAPTHSPRSRSPSSDPLSSNSVDILPPIPHIHIQRDPTSGERHLFVGSASDINKIMPISTYKNHKKSIISDIGYIDIQDVVAQQQMKNNALAAMNDSNDTHQNIHQITHNNLPSTVTPLPTSKRFTSVRRKDGTTPTINTPQQRQQQSVTTTPHLPRNDSNTHISTATSTKRQLHDIYSSRNERRTKYDEDFYNFSFSSSSSDFGSDSDLSQGWSFSEHSTDCSEIDSDDNNEVMAKTSQADQKADKSSKFPQKDKISIKMKNKMLSIPPQCLTLPTSNTLPHNDMLDTNNEINQLSTSATLTPFAQSLLNSHNSRSTPFPLKNPTPSHNNEGNDDSFDEPSFSRATFSGALLSRPNTQSFTPKTPRSNGKHAIKHQRTTPTLLFHATGTHRHVLSQDFCDTILSAPLHLASLRDMNIKPAQTEPTLSNNAKIHKKDIINSKNDGNEIVQLAPAAPFQLPSQKPSNCANNYQTMQNHSQDQTFYYNTIVKYANQWFVTTANNLQMVSTWWSSSKPSSPIAQDLENLNISQTTSIIQAQSQNASPQQEKGWVMTYFPHLFRSALVSDPTPDSPQLPTPTTTQSQNGWFSQCEDVFKRNMMVKSLSIRPVHAVNQLYDTCCEVFFKHLPRDVLSSHGAISTSDTMEISDTNMNARKSKFYHYSKKDRKKRLSSIAPSVPALSQATITHTGSSDDEYDVNDYLQYLVTRVEISKQHSHRPIPLNTLPHPSNFVPFANVNSSTVNNMNNNQQQDVFKANSPQIHAIGAHPRFDANINYTPVYRSLTHDIDMDDNDTNSSDDDFFKNVLNQQNYDYDTLNRRFDGVKIDDILKIHPISPQMDQNHEEMLNFAPSNIPRNQSQKDLSATTTLPRITPTVSAHSSSPTRPSSSCYTTESTTIASSTSSLPTHYIRPISPQSRQSFVNDVKEILGVQYDAQLEPLLHDFYLTGLSTIHVIQKEVESGDGRVLLDLLMEQQVHDAGSAFQPIVTLQREPSPTQ